MKKILTLTRNFPPLVGGMERLCLHMVDELSCRFDVHLIAPHGAAAHARVAVTEVTGRPLFRFLTELTLATFRVARRWKPDVILAGSGLTALTAAWVAQWVGARAVAYVHGLDVAVRHPIYGALWHPALRRMDIIANSQATARLAQSIGIKPERISIIHPGVSLPEPDPAARQRFRTEQGLGDAPVLLFVGRLSARKGLREFVADSLPLIVARIPNVQLVVIGGLPVNALHAEGQSVESIRQAAGRLVQHLHFLGEMPDPQLADAYAGADVHVFPIRHLPENPEGFGMVAVEAAAHGLASVAYATGGVVDAVAPGVSGHLASPGDAPVFAELVCQTLSKKLPEEEMRQFAAQFAWSEFGRKMGALLAAEE